MTPPLPPPRPTRATARLAAEHYHGAKSKLLRCRHGLAPLTDNKHAADIAREGLELIEAALRIEPREPKYWHTRAMLLADGLGDYASALICLRRASELEPGSVVFAQAIRSC